MKQILQRNKELELNVVLFFTHYENWTTVFSGKPWKTIVSNEKRKIVLGLFNHIFSC